MYKLTSILFILITSLTASFNIHANTQHMLASCLMEDSVCNDTSKKRSMALRIARAFANKEKGSGKFNLFVQADSNDTVIEYSYNYFQDFEVFEGPDGRDMSYPVMRVNLITEHYVTGDKKTAAKWLVSPEYNTKLALADNGFPSINGSTIDIDSFCSGDMSLRIPEDIIDGCKNALIRSGYFDNAHIITETSVSQASKLFGGISGALDALIAGITVNLNGERAVSEAKKITEKFGSPKTFTSLDGYVLLLNPQTDGTIKTVKLVAPPNINIPLQANGDLIDTDTLTENAEKGYYTFDHSSQRFVSLMAARTGLKQWTHLSRLLEAGFVCNRCKVKITDLPPQPK